MSTPDLFTTIQPPREPDADAARRRPEHHRRADVATGCSNKRTGPPQAQCSLGDGDGAYSANGGLTHQCKAHVPPNFFDFRKTA